MEFVAPVLENIRSNYEEIFSAEKKVADYILKNPEDSVRMAVSELAERSGASDATVIRLCKHLGYKGFYQMKLQLAHDLGRDQLISGNLPPQDPDNWNDILHDIAGNILKIKNHVDHTTLMQCVSLIARCHTVHMAATGNSVPIATDFAFRLGRVGIRTSSSMLPEHQLNNINLGAAGDVVVGISHSGASRQVLQAFELAKKRGMHTIAVTDLLRTPVGNAADFALPTGVEYSSVYLYGAASHVYITVLLDLLLYFAERSRKNAAAGGEADNVEYYLSETKL